MYNSTPPTKTDLPSTGRLIKSTIVAALAASFILVTVVMPAEYGIDPTGIGAVTGLKKMGAIKTSLAKEAAADAALEPVVIIPDAPPVTTAPTPPSPAAVTERTDEKTFTLAPDGWTEIKLKMNKGDRVNYLWFSDGGRINFDTHADSKTLKIKYHNYAKGSKIRDEGVLTAEFNGSHGWFWRNRTGKTVLVSLQTKGHYQDIIVTQ